MQAYLSYVRTSTSKRDQSANGNGYSFASQEASIKKFVETVEGGGVIIGSYSDQESGANNQRPGLVHCLEHAKRSGAIIVVARLDRLSRSLTFVSQLCDSKIPFRVAEMPSATPLTISIYAALAQEERRSISARVKAAMAAKKARHGEGIFGFRDKKKAVENMVNGIKSARDNHFKVIRPVIEELRSTGVVTLQGLADGLNRRGYFTRRNKPWVPTTVRRYAA